MQHDANTRDAGSSIVSGVLGDASQAKCVAVRDGKTVTTDGPFAEALEQRAGFFLIECECIERAIERVSRIPEAAFGLVEVRPILELRGAVSD